MTGLEFFFGIMVLLQSLRLWQNANKIDALEKIRELNRKEINSGNELISAHANVQKAAATYIESLEKQVKENYNAAVYWKKRSQEHFDRLPTINIKDQKPN